MTIAQAFNDIAVAQGGTASTSGTIAGAIDALNDALAGSDQESCQTIEGAVRLLGQHISSGGGGSTEYDIKCYLSTDGGLTYTEAEDIVYEAEWSTEDYIWVKKEGTQPLTKSVPGVTLFIDNQEEWNTNALYGLGEDDAEVPISNNAFVMPAHYVDVARFILN